MGTFNRHVRASAVVLLALSLLASVMVAGITVAQNQGGGNSAAAALCRGDGYKSLTRLDGTPFGSVGECMSYAAQSGGVEVLATHTPVPSPTPTADPMDTPESYYPTLLLTNDLPGRCTVLARATDLSPGTSYIIAIHEIVGGGAPLIHEFVVPGTHAGTSGFRLQWVDGSLDREFHAYLMTFDRIVISDSGPLVVAAGCHF